MTNEELAVELEKIGSLDTLQAEDVVSAAKSANHPLHAYFQWDDKAAGHLYRVQQARDLIRAAVRVTVVVNKVEVEVPMYVKNPETETSGYVRTDAVRSGSGTAEAIVRQAAKTTLGHMRRLVALAETYKVDHGLAKALNQLEKLSSDE